MQQLKTDRQAGIATAALIAANALPPKQTITLAELFCGAGGMALGAHRARLGTYGYKHVWATDYDRDACETFKHNFPKTKVIKADIRRFDFSEVERTHGLLFGFPCNDFSNVGEQKGTKGKFGGLYRYCVKALQELQPLFFVAENVGGLRSSNNNKDYLRILDELAGCGYTVVPNYYKFEEYAVPQRRHRIIIVGFLSSTGITFKHEPPFDNYVSAKDAMDGIPEDAPNHELTKQSKTVMERLSYIKEGQNAFTAKIPERLQLNVKGAKLSMIYKRLKENEPSYTITGSGGGGTHVYHWKENRALTNRERARLQTFPDAFSFLGGRESVRKQIGMAVPPDGARVVFKRILETLNEHKIIDQITL